MERFFGGYPPLSMLPDLRPILPTPPLVPGMSLLPGQAAFQTFQTQNAGPQPLFFFVSPMEASARAHEEMAARMSTATAPKKRGRPFGSKDIVPRAKRGQGKLRVPPSTESSEPPSSVEGEAEEQSEPASKKPTTERRKVSKKSRDRAVSGSESAARDVPSSEDNRTNTSVVDSTASTPRAAVESSSSPSLPQDTTKPMKIQSLFNPVLNAPLPSMTDSSSNSDSQLRLVEQDHYKQMAMLSGTAQKLAMPSLLSHASNAFSMLAQGQQTSPFFTTGMQPAGMAPYNTSTFPQFSQMNNNLGQNPLGSASSGPVMLPVSAQSLPVRQNLNALQGLQGLDLQALQNRGSFMFPLGRYQ